MVSLLPTSPALLRLQAERRGPAPGSRLAAIAYPSGTTGAPKGVVLTHENLLWATLACGQARGDAADALGACLSPLTHTPVLVSHLLCRVLAGAGAVLFERFDLATVLDAVERHGITELPLIGGMVFDVVHAGSVPAGVRRAVRRGWLVLPHRAPEGRHHHRGRERVARRGRGRAAHASRRGRRGGDWHAASPLGRAGDGGGRAARRRRPRSRRARRLPRHAV